MTEVKFYESIEDELLMFAVIISKTQNQYVFCKHKDRNTWEFPGGHREQLSDNSGNWETILDTAKRELYEETGALEFDIKPLCVYSVTAPNQFDGKETFGMLFFADIKCFETELHSEIEKIAIMDGLPEQWTYPDIQPHLINEAKRRGYL
ncbi:MAG: NUDIX domain-containing protein [Lachnospiraceae bacterium]|nr:NUDIX domain-containing protein [Lachnospiraceae bacterium]